VVQVLRIGKLAHVPANLAAHRHHGDYDVHGRVTPVVDETIGALCECPLLGGKCGF
jgi:hypothetical protein